MVRHRIVLTGGGTGGHIYPALAVAELLKNDPEVERILFIGAAGHLEERLAKERGLDFVGLRISGLPRKLSPALFTWPLLLSTAVAAARKTLKAFAPSVVLGTGGYASAPPLIAACIAEVPYAIHEPDAHPGMVNRVMSNYARLVSCGMEGAVDQLKSRRGRVVVNGNPVRQSFVNLMRRDSAAAVLGLNHELKTVLITGGSQGARALNDAVLDALPGLLERDPPLQIIHQVGEKNFYEYKERLPASIQANKNYFMRDYFDDLSIAYAVCDLAVCRSGAMTIADLTAAGTAAIFVPYPFAAANHQMHNARFIESKGAALVIPQEDLTGDRLRNEIVGILNDDDRLSGMRRVSQGCGKPQAASDLTSQLKEVSTEYQLRGRWRTT